MYHIVDLADIFERHHIVDLAEMFQRQKALPTLKLVPNKLRLALPVRALVVEIG